MNSIERLDKYATGLPVEGVAELPQDPTAAQWPQMGAISVKNLSIAYEQRPDYDVIKNISFEVMAGEKIGICGRSGCGKSTLVSSLFRLLERRTGTIEIDGLDIAKLGLKTLRRRLQIIPQDPVLFEGSIRSNLGLNYTDQELWDALDHVGLKDFVSDLERKLYSPVFINGSNLSFGQRQLFCLCRAMLAKPKILVLDEATASIDGASDERINYIIKNHFKDTTILSIAHRLDSIGDFDRIMLIDNGEMAEFDKPSTLLSDPNSKFSALVAASMV